MVSKTARNTEDKKAEYLQTICSASGWTVEMAEKHMAEANKVGMSCKRYVKNKCWRLSIDEIAQMNARIEERLKKKASWTEKMMELDACSQQEAERRYDEAQKLGLDLDQYIANRFWTLTPDKMKDANAEIDAIQTIQADTNWDEDRVRAEIAKAEALGISRKSYLTYHGWEFTDDELQELQELLVLKKEFVKQDDDWHVKVVCEKTGWTYSHALQLMREAKKKGYSFKSFIRRSLWKMTEAEIAALPEYKQKMSETKKQSIRRKAAQAEEYRKLIMQEMGWTAGRTRLETLRASILCGSSDAEFYLFKIYKNGVEKGKEFITSVYNSRMNTRYASWDGGYRLFENKGLFNQDFKDFIHRQWFLSKDLSYLQFKKKTKGLTKIICKPLNGIEGIGIEVFTLDGTEKNRREVFNKIREKGNCIVEQFIHQHDALSKFYPHSVNTLRVMSFLDGGQGKILNSVIKFGTTAMVDNYYQGSIAAGVDVKTGKICTDGVDYAGNVYKEHPYSGQVFCGFQIPHWDDLVELIRVAATIHPESPYVGWDIAISQSGPEIVEGNHNQGAYLCQYPFAIYSSEGRRHTIDPYLWFD